MRVGHIAVTIVGFLKAVRNSSNLRIVNSHGIMFLIPLIINCHSHQTKQFVDNKEHTLLYGRHESCDPQKFMQPSPASHIHGVIHLGQSEPQLYSGSEYDADVCVV